MGPVVPVNEVVDAIMNSMPTDHIIALLLAERDKLNAAIESLKGTSPAPKKPSAVETSATSPATKKRRFSAAARRKMAAAQKKRWAAIKAAK
jgi:hypothetical protein